MTNPRVVFIGAVHEALPALTAVADHPEAELAAVVTLDDTEAARLSGAVDLAATAEQLGSSVIRVTDVNSPEAVSAIRALEPALLVVVGWTRLIRDELLKVPAVGCVGFHASLLPHNRGRAPVNWAIIRGETQTGNTMMLLDAGVDTGGIVDQRATPILLADTCRTVYDRVGDLGAAMLRDNLGDLLAGRAQIRPQDETHATHLPKRTPAMGVTDWRRSPVDIHNWIRAQTAPYPGAHTWLDGTKISLWSSLPPLELLPTDRDPGEIEAIDATGMRVSCGGGSVIVTEVSAEGGEPRPVAETAADLGLKPGARFALPAPDVTAWALGLGPKPTSM